MSVDIYWGGLPAPPAYQVVKMPQSANTEAMLLLSLQAEPYKFEYSTKITGGLTPAPYLPMPKGRGFTAFFR